MRKVYRWCPIQNKKVICDGLCNVISDDGAVHICSVREKALDVALNVEVHV